MTPLVGRLIEISVFPIAYRTLDTTSKEVQHVFGTLLSVIETIPDVMEMFKMSIGMFKLFCPYFCVFPDQFRRNFYRGLQQPNDRLIDIIDEVSIGTFLFCRGYRNGGHSRKGFNQPVESARHIPQYLWRKKPFGTLILNNMGNFLVHDPEFPA